MGGWGGGGISERLRMLNVDVHSIVTCHRVRSGRDLNKDEDMYAYYRSIFTLPKAVHPTQPFQYLRVLLLRRCDQVQDDALLTLESCHSLTELDLNNCTSITDQALKKYVMAFVQACFRQVCPALSACTQPRPFGWLRPTSLSGSNVAHDRDSQGGGGG